MAGRADSGAAPHGGRACTGTVTGGERHVHGQWGSGLHGQQHRPPCPEAMAPALWRPLPHILSVSTVQA